MDYSPYWNFFFILSALRNLWIFGDNQSLGNPEKWLLAFTCIKSAFTHSQHLRAALHKVFLSVFDVDTYLEETALKIFQTCTLDNQIRISERDVQQTIFLRGT